MPIQKTNKNQGTLWKVDQIIRKTKLLRITLTAKIKFAPPTQLINEHLLLHHFYYFNSSILET